MIGGLVRGFSAISYITRVDCTWHFLGSIGGFGVRLHRGDVALMWVDIDLAMCRSRVRRYEGLGKEKVPEYERNMFAMTTYRNARRVVNSIALTWESLCKYWRRRHAIGA